MISDQEFREYLRNAIVKRLEQLREEYLHWLGELKKLDELALVRVDRGISSNTEEELPPNVVRMVRRG